MTETAQELGCAQQPAMSHPAKPRRRRKAWYTLAAGAGLALSLGTQVQVQAQGQAGQTQQEQEPIFSGDPRLRVNVYRLRLEDADSCCHAASGVWFRC